MSTPIASVTTPDPRAPGEGPPKRRRLNFACNYCRSRKSRCDEQKPSCRACLTAGIPCVTVDRRRPGVSITRHEAGSAPYSQGITAATTPKPPSAASPGSGTGLPGSATQRRPSAPVPLTPRSVSEGQDDGPSQRSREGHSLGEDEVRDPAGDVHAETDYANQTTKFSGRLPMLRPSKGSCTSELLTDWLDLALHRLGIRKRLGPLLTSDDSMVPSQLPEFSLTFPPLPDSRASQELLFLYLEEVNSVFPVLDAIKAGQSLDLALQIGPAAFSREQGFLPLLILYLVLSIGALSHESREWQEFSRTTLNYCKSYVGHLMGWNTLQAVQAMFLLSVCLKCHDQLSAGWSALSLCVSMATSRGLNRPGSPQRRAEAMSKPDGETDRRRTWWTIYCFERLFSFEMCKPSLIPDESCLSLELGSWSFSTGGGRHPRPAFLRIISRLADLLGDIGRQAIQARNAEEVAGSSGINEAIKGKVKTISEVCVMLMTWADELPNEYKPRSDFIYDADGFPFASFITLQYNQAILMLMRNSLLLSNKAIQLAIDIVARNTPWEHIIRNGTSVAVNAARRTVQLLMEAADVNARPLFPSLSAPLHALYVLAINIIKNPKSRMARSDLNLIRDAVEFARHRYDLTNPDGKLNLVLDKLDVLITRVIESSTPTPQPASMRRSTISGVTPILAEAMADGQSLHPSSHGGMALGGGHPMEQQAVFGQTDMTNIDFSTMLGLSPAVSQDASLSPEDYNDIGWDWVDFTQLFPDPV